MREKLSALLDDVLDSALVLAGAILLLIIMLAAFRVQSKEPFRRNVGLVQVHNPPPLLWPPPKPVWFAGPNDFVVANTADAAQPKGAGCTAPAQKWHGMALIKCVALPDKSIGCTYKIRTGIVGSDGVDLGTWVGVLGMRRAACKGTFVPVMMEMVPPDGLGGAVEAPQDPGDL